MESSTRKRIAGEGISRDGVVIMTKELYWFEDDDLMTYQGCIDTTTQDGHYIMRTHGWYLIPDDALLEGL